ncbi:Polynucleotidyl transferase [Perilla frutescens var. hirtella]|uniref:Polynucleotidyl transferase n=1 Tax=Perilla frutescens var. hirtella TaxID=608512 RepID=A0AAD4JJF3_PERFH|nr:Polynucleotidyl transferase [Perilla frutescens var. hirtella]
MEFRSLLQGLLLLPQTASYVWIELDAAAVVSVITSNVRGSGQLKEVFSRLRLILRDRHVRVTHIHREGNPPADFLARLGHEVDRLHIFDAQTALRPLVSLVRMDQLGYPNFRFRR